MKSQKLYVRKPLINDWIAAFARACRSTSRDRDRWTYPVMDTKPTSGGHSYPAELLIPFIAYATKHTPNYIYTSSHIVGMSLCFQSMNEPEQEYALYIFEKYYVIPTRQIGEYQPYLSRYLQQELSDSSELSEYD